MPPIFIEFQIELQMKTRKKPYIVQLMRKLHAELETSIEHLKAKKFNSMEPKLPKDSKNN